jgi:hypothetical protein
MEQYKDRKDVVFLSLNIDDNPGLIGPIMAEQKLSFIVLPAYSYVNDKLKIDVIPENWIVDRDGIIRLKGTGSYDSIEKWEPGMKDAIEKVRAQR